MYVSARAATLLCPLSRRLICTPATAAAFLEFHEPLASWLHPGTLGASKDDTLLVSGEIYNNYTKMDVFYKTPAH